MALLVIFSEKGGKNQFSMLKQQLLHCGAMIEKLLDDSQDFIPIFKMSRE